MCADTNIFARYSFKIKEKIQFKNDQVNSKKENNKNGNSQIYKKKDEKRYKILFEKLKSCDFFL